MVLKFWVVFSRKRADHWFKNHRKPCQWNLFQTHNRTISISFVGCTLSRWISASDRAAVRFLYRCDWELCTTQLCHIQIEWWVAGTRQKFVHRGVDHLSSGWQCRWFCCAVLSRAVGWVGGLVTFPLKNVRLARSKRYPINCNRVLPYTKQV